MALVTYDVLKHHIGLKERGGATNFGFMLDGGYTKELQREGVGSLEFGGSTDLIGQEASLSRWTQDDFLGGAYQYTWGRDDAMFADSQGFLPNQQARSVATVPPLFHKFAVNVSDDSNFAALGSAYNPVAMFTVGGYIFIVFRHGIYRYDIGTPGVTFVTIASLTSDSAAYATDAMYDSNDQMIYILVTMPTGTAITYIQRLKTDLTEPANQQAYTLPAATDGLVGKGLQVLDNLIVVGIGRQIYTADPPENTATASLNATFAKIGRLPGPWIDSVSYAGMTYILCGGIGYTTHVMAFDGQQLMPIVTFPFNFAGKCLAVYGGRIFVGGTGTDVNGAEWYAELYEVTGASVRLVRTFAPEVLRSGATWPSAINALAVYEGLLWFAHKGTKLIAYDLTSDGFFGASAIVGASDVDFTKFAVGRGRLWGWGHSDAAFTTKDGIYRIAQPADEASLASYSPWLTTSDFAYEPGVKKRFSELKVLTRYGALTTAEYSLDGGTTWTSASIVTTANGQWNHNVVSLAAAAISEQIRFRFTCARGTNATIFVELVAYTVTFAFLDTSKRGWSFVINVSERIEARDKTTFTPDISEYAEQLWTWARDKTRLTFTDIDGTTPEVQIVGFREHQPIIGPNIGSDARPEAHFSVQLVEI